MTRLKYKRLDSLGNKSRPVLKAGPFGSSVKKESYVDSGFKVYGQQEVLSGNLGAKNYYINQEIFDRHKNCSVQAGDILITMMGTVGKVLVIPSEHEPGIINPRLMRVSLDSTKVNPEFVKSFLEMPKLQKLLERRSHGGTMPGLNAEAIASIKVPVPDLKYQNYAVQVFALWDTAIEKTEALIVTKERQFRWLLNSLMCIPATDWDSCTLKEISKIRKGQQLNRDTFEDSGKYPVWNGGISPSGFTTNYNTLANTITISEGGSCGFVNYCNENFWLGGHCYALEKINPQISSEFLFFFLKTHEHRIMSLKVGSGLPNIQKRDIERFAIHYPRYTEQKRIAEILNTARHEIDQLKSLAKQYGMQKRGLMQKLLTGKWRIDNG